MSAVLLEISREFQIDVLTLAGAPHEESGLVKQDTRADGGELLHVTVALTPATVPALAALVTRAIRSKKHVSLKIKGVTVRGLKEGRIACFLTTPHRKRLHWIAWNSSVPAVSGPAR